MDEKKKIGIILCIDGESPMASTDETADALEEAEKLLHTEKNKKIPKKKQKPHRKMRSPPFLSTEGRNQATHSSLLTPHS